MAMFTKEKMRYALNLILPETQPETIVVAVAAKENWKNYRLYFGPAASTSWAVAKKSPSPVKPLDGSPKETP